MVLVDNRPYTGILRREISTLSIYHELMHSSLGTPASYTKIKPKSDNFCVGFFIRHGAVVHEGIIDISRRVLARGDNLLDVQDLLARERHMSTSVDEPSHNLLDIGIPGKSRYPKSK